ncbi:9105_t:CDS:2, partial [Paraglomus occultum]
GQKRKASEGLSLDPPAQRKQCLEQFPTTAPSSLAVLANIKEFLPEKLRTTPPTFYSNRPTQDYASFPAALLHPVFGQFQHDREHYEPKQEDNMLLQELSMKMVRFYDYERERSRVFREILEKYGIQLMAAEVDNSSSCTDGHMQEKGNVCVISEAKNELGLGTKDPYFQGAFYYVELIRRHAYERINSVLPCILIYYAGPNFGFAALAMTDAKIHVAPLTPLIPLYTEPHDYFMQKMAARAFGALRRAVIQLKKYYNEGNAQIQNPLPVSPESLEFPYIREFIPIQG